MVFKLKEKLSLNSVRFEKMASIVIAALVTRTEFIDLISSEHDFLLNLRMLEYLYMNIHSLY